LLQNCLVAGNTQYPLPVKPVKTIRTQLTCLCVAACCAGHLASCNRDGPERTAPRHNEPGSTVRPDDQFATQDAEAARERAQFESSMRETADAFSQEMRALKTAIAALPASRQEEGRQRIAELEQMLAGFKAQIAAMEKAGGVQWAGYRKAVLGSSLHVKGHLNRAAELVAPAEAEAGPQ
jgi:hypothetical protein